MSLPLPNHDSPPESSLFYSPPSSPLFQQRRHSSLRSSVARRIRFRSFCISPCSQRPMGSEGKEGDSMKDNTTGLMMDAKKVPKEDRIKDEGKEKTKDTKQPNEELLSDLQARLMPNVPLEILRDFESQLKQRLKQELEHREGEQQLIESSLSDDFQQRINDPALFSRNQIFSTSSQDYNDWKPSSVGSRRSSKLRAYRRRSFSTPESIEESLHSSSNISHIPEVDFATKNPKDPLTKTDVAPAQTPRSALASGLEDNQLKLSDPLIRMSVDMKQSRSSISLMRKSYEKANKRQREAEERGPAKTQTMQEAGYRRSSDPLVRMSYDLSSRPTGGSLQQSYDALKRRSSSVAREKSQDGKKNSNPIQSSKSSSRNVFTKFSSETGLSENLRNVQAQRSAEELTERWHEQSLAQIDELRKRKNLESAPKSEPMEAKKVKNEAKEQLMPPNSVPASGTELGELGNEQNLKGATESKQVGETTINSADFQRATAEAAPQSKEMQELFAWLDRMLQKWKDQIVAKLQSHVLRSLQGQRNFKPTEHKEPSTMVQQLNELRSSNHTERRFSDSAETDEPKTSISCHREKEESKSTTKKGNRCRHRSRTSSRRHRVYK